jgi:hypothetical protein
MLQNCHLKHNIFADEVLYTDLWKTQEKQHRRSKQIRHSDWLKLHQLTHGASDVLFEY